MRIVKFLVISLTFIAILAGIAFLISREVMLIWGMSHLRTSVSKMKTIAANMGPYVNECQNRGGGLTGTVIETIQLRFTSDTEYQLEVICSQFQLTPIIVDKGKLPLFLKKTPGSGGLLWHQPLTSVTLTLWGRERSLIVENDEVTYTNASPNTPIGSGPVTSCQGYGFTCCQAESTQGSGDQINTASDCPRTCYSRCISRPIVLSFTSEPFFDPQNRSVSVSSGELVTFSYVIDMGAAKTGQVALEYGDGQIDQFDQAIHTFDHTYNCTRGNCQFSAKIKVIDSHGTESVATPVTHILIKVSPN